jgi:hypothetical protein
VTAAAARRHACGGSTCVRNRCVGPPRRFPDRRAAVTVGGRDGAWRPSSCREARRSRRVGLSAVRRYSRTSSFHVSLCAQSAHCQRLVNTRVQGTLAERRPSARRPQVRRPRRFIFWCWLCGILDVGGFGSIASPWRQSNQQSGGLHAKLCHSFIDHEPMRCWGDGRRTVCIRSKQVRWCMERCVSDKIRTMSARHPRCRAGSQRDHRGCEHRRFALRPRVAHRCGEGDRTYGCELRRRVGTRFGQFRQRNVASPHGKRQLRGCLDGATTLVLSCLVVPHRAGGP